MHIISMSSSAIIVIRGIISVQELYISAPHMMTELRDDSTDSNVTNH